MKVICGNCKTVFDYEENSKICPNCKKYCNISDKKLKELKEREKEKISEIKQENEAEDIALVTKDLKEEETQNKKFYLIIALLLAIIILPISMRTDPSTKINGTDGTIISTQTTKMVLNDLFNDLFYIEKIGYTDGGNLYVLYESNIYGFQEKGYEIKFAVTNADGEYVEIGCFDSDFKAVENEVQITYFTKAIFNYTNKMPRITKLHITLNDMPLKTIEF